MSAIRIPGPRKDPDDSIHWRAYGPRQAMEAARRRICHVCGQPLEPATVNLIRGTALCPNGHETKVV